ncbi:cytochrome c [Rhodanobacter sp. L36]|uniref:c-type cytochrome n=1 Tax=Rhodanobacter sp. L36 TaxID=1747221 RepID=UPI00131CF0F5
MKFIAAFIILFVIIGLGVVGLVWSGEYDIGADSPHSTAVFAMLQMLRQRSVEHHARDIAIPANLGDEQVILKGAGQYAAMCTGCHLAPGTAGTELRPGLYPQPPDFSRSRPIDPRAAFWTIKHGIKMSAMPAWGGSHDDATIWSMVAFLQRLPTLTPAGYRAIVARAPPDDDMDMDHAPQSAPASAGSTHL